MKQSVVSRCLLYVGTCVLGLLIAIISHTIGYNRGALDASARRMPFDLSLYLTMHEMSRYIDTPAATAPKSSWRPENIKVLLYSTLKFYEDNKNRWAHIETENPKLYNDIVLARELVKDLELVGLGESVESMLKNEVKARHENAEMEQQGQPLNER